MKLLSNGHVFYLNDVMFVVFFLVYSTKHSESNKIYISSFLT